MINLFRSKKDKLQKQYEKKMAEAYKMSSINRAKSDQLMYEADQLLKQMEK
jgi:hypothetical protein